MEGSFGEVRGIKLGRFGKVLRSWTEAKLCAHTGLFTLLLRVGLLGSPLTRCGICPVQCRKAMPALTFAQRGTPTEGPPFPSRLVSKHMPPAKKTPIRGVGKDWSERYNFGVEPGLPLSPLRGGPAFLLPQRPGTIRQCFLCTEQEARWTSVHKISIIPAGRIMSPPRVAPPDRGVGHGELPLDGLLRSSPKGLLRNPGRYSVSFLVDDARGSDR